MSENWHLQRPRFSPPLGTLTLFWIYLAERRSTDRSTLGDEGRSMFQMTPVRV